jgi:O-antigen/teichoic acid export membrane protein
MNLMGRRGSPRSLRTSLAGWTGGRPADGLSAFSSSLGLMAGRVASMGLGFLAWLVAARLFAPDEVGLASGAVAAMMFCVQLALIGIGSAVIALFPRHRDDPEALLNTSLLSVALVAILMGGAFLVLARGVFRELDTVAATPVLALAFIAMTLFGAVNVLMDNLSVAIRRGDQVLTRNVAFGLVTIGFPLALSRVGPAYGTWVILLAWTLAGLAACTIGAFQVHRTLPGFRPRIELRLPLARRLVGVGLPNWALTMTERGPALLMPVLVTELISPTTNAFWYAAWMMAWVVMIIPISVGQTLFAEAAREPDRAGAATRHGLLTSLGLGVLAAAGMALLARFALGLLGSAYADAGVGALRVLVVTVVPFSLIQAYYALCRAGGRLGEATAAGAIFGAAAVAAALAAGLANGLTAMAAGWLIVQCLAGGWAALRLRALARGAGSLRAAPATDRLEGPRQEGSAPTP